MRSRRPYRGSLLRVPVRDSASRSWRNAASFLAIRSRRPLRALCRSRPPLQSQHRAFPSPAMLPADWRSSSERARCQKANTAGGVQPLVSRRRADPTLAHRINRSEGCGSGNGRVDPPRGWRTSRLRYAAVAAGDGPPLPCCMDSTRARCDRHRPSTIRPRLDAIAPRYHDGRFMALGLRHFRQEPPCAAVSRPHCAEGASVERSHFLFT